MSVFGKKSPALETIVGSGTTVSGQVSAQGAIRVDGTIEGDVRADRVIVGETGKIRGNIRARGTVVGGSVEGDIDASESVELTAKSRTSGEIRTPKLTVAEGAFFDGSSRMQGEPPTSGAESTSSEESP